MKLCWFLFKIDVLQAEVAALKTLVLSSSPTSPTQEPLPGGKTPFKRGHARNKSTSSAMSGSHQDLNVIQPFVKDCKEVTRQGLFPLTVLILTYSHHWGVSYDFCQQNFLAVLRWGRLNLELAAFRDSSIPFSTWLTLEYLLKTW